MAFLEINNVRIVGMISSVPFNMERNEVWMRNHGVSNQIASEFINEHGIVSHRTTNKLTGLDLCIEATRKLLKDICWEADEVDALLFATAFPDYVLPNNACIMQDKLGLRTDCYTHDIALESSGWIYGMSSATSLLNTGNIKRVLLCTGLANVRLDKSIFSSLLGHGASVTALEYDESAQNPIRYHFSSMDNIGEIEVTQYGMRKHRDLSVLQKESDANRLTSDTHIENGRLMDSILAGVEQTISALLQEHEDLKTNMDYCVTNIPSVSLLKQFSKNQNIDISKLQFCISECGYIGASIIPFSICSLMGSKIGDKKRFICCTAGELSCESMAFQIDKDIVVDTIYVED